MPKFKVRDANIHLDRKYLIGETVEISDNDMIKRLERFLAPHIEETEVEIFETPEAETPAPEPSEAAEPPVEEEKPKRKRGRPRKNASA